MFILKEHVQAETFARNSRFLSDLFVAGSPEEAKEIWHTLKSTYDNGGHIVYAFITGPQGNVQGCSDDGEPSGTAGRPTLEVLKGSGLTNVLLTTARWFGGTLLGTGGLVRAYTSGAQEVLEKAVKIPLVPMVKISLNVSYPLYEMVKRILMEFDCEILAEEFTDKVTLIAGMEKKFTLLLKDRLNELGNGKIQPRIEELDLLSCQKL
ncbi:MAG: YigZ family protein [Lentisphaeria bacterium]|nr:YigZ family protein [Lentisphaeria bacterium]